jgi:hypothetical protein
VDYIARSLADGLAHVADNVAMPVLLFITVRRSLRASSSNGLLTAFSGGSVRPMLRAAMTTTGRRSCTLSAGQPAVLPAAIATVFAAAGVSPYWQAKDVSQSGSSDAPQRPDEADRAQSHGDIDPAGSRAGHCWLADSAADRGCALFAIASAGPSQACARHWGRPWH